MIRYANWSISRKLLVPGQLFLLILIVSVAVFSSNRYEKAYNEGFEKEVKLIETLVEAPLINAAWNFDSVLAESTLESLKDYQGFVFATVQTDSNALATFTPHAEMDAAWTDASMDLIASGESRLEIGDLRILSTPLIRDNETIAYLILGVDTSYISELLFSSNVQSAILGLIAYIAYGSILFLVSRSVSGPMTRVVGRLEELHQGNTDIVIPEENRKDEIGAIGKAVANLRDGTIEREQLSREQEAHQAQQMQVVNELSDKLSLLAKGDLTATIDMDFPLQYQQLRIDFNATSLQLRETVKSVVDAAKDIHARSEEISGASNDLSSRTETQAATLEQTAAALDQLTDGLKNTADGANTVSSSMHETKEAAETGGIVVERTVSAMSEIERSSEHISQIIGVIDDIAFQTNLLALNAGVEAARAGKAGVGFSVVASEVQSLAQRSAESATEIKSLIQASTDHVNNGVKLVGETGTALNHIADRINSVFSLNADISEGTRSQSIGINEINSAMVGLDQVTQQNAAMVEEATAASHAMIGSASQLLEIVSQFRTDDVRSEAAQWDLSGQTETKMAS